MVSHPGEHKRAARYQRGRSLWRGRGSSVFLGKKKEHPINCLVLAQGPLRRSGQRLEIGLESDETLMMLTGITSVRRKSSGMDVRDHPRAANQVERASCLPFNPPSRLTLLSSGEHVQSHDERSAYVRSQEQAPEGAQREYLAKGSADGFPSSRTSPLPFHPEDTTAGNALSQMMTLSAARAPVATQDEVRARLWHFSRHRAGLPLDAFFYANAELISSINQAIEGRMTDHLQAGELYVGVQRLSRVVGRLPRYLALLQQVRYGYLYGLNDLQAVSERSGFSHPRLVTVVLHQSRRTDLEWFWFLVVDTPQFQTALVTEQIEGDPWSDTPQIRTYKGFWTFDPDRVAQVVRILRHGARSLLG